MSVTIRSSLDKPFGKLANDAILPFKVNSHTYTSVVNFVYANLLPESTFKEELSQTLPKNVVKTFNEVRTHLKQSTIQSSAHTAIKEKAKQNQQFLQKLMDTENLKIVYYSPNNFLGIGRSKDGENIYGQALEQVRNELQSEQNKLQQKDNIYLSYIAEINLKKAFRKHNLEKYISKDKKRSIRRLVDTLVKDYGNTEVYLNSPDIDTILTLHEKRNIMTYTDPNSLIRIVRKNEARNVLKRNLFDLKVAALNAFVDYTISKNVTISEDKTALKDQIFDILPLKREEFANRILDLYSAKALPDEVKDKIKKFKTMWYFPSERDIEFYNSENIKLPEITEDSTLTVDTFKVYIENDVLSPLHENTFTVSNRKFKSVSHFIAYELNKLYGQMDPAKLYIRIKDVKTSDLDQFNKIIEKDVFTTTKNKLLEDAINLKLQEWSIRNLIFVVENLEFEDTYDLDKTEEFYNKYKDKIVLKIQKIPSFEQFVEKDFFLTDIIKDKIDFYFMILDNLMVHTKAKHRLQVSYDSLVEMSPFYSFIMMNDSNVPKTKIPEYLIQKNRQYGLTNQSLLQIWSIIYNGIKMSEKIVGENGYDIRYKSLLIWSKYFLGKPNTNLQSLEVMQSRQEDNVLMVLLAILSKLKEINLKFNSPSINTQDLQTAIHLCLGKVRVYSHEFEKVEEDLEFEDEILQPNEVEVYDDVDEEQIMEDDDDNFEGFNLNSRKKFEAFLQTYFNPLKNELDLGKMEEAVYKILNSKIPVTIKHQNLNFFISGFKAPLSLD
ncbi:hypothetical protein IIV22_037L [Invertebrate iridescent virus 22]|uniref:Uncharacterized protein n=1 Tax=Invertebrate iridescent virus 22 TaxID=345198 RepID=S6DDQ0_9VIRU|nr:hypothetical protein IIV22_037L [Invertebrate iridescent virus 22]CCV01714.1 hypothetical protein IIV22_037L [Invertebrate iridescent virus 22]